MDRVKHDLATRTPAETLAAGEITVSPGIGGVAAREVDQSKLYCDELDKLAASSRTWISRKKEKGQ